MSHSGNLSFTQHFSLYFFIPHSNFVNFPIMSIIATFFFLLVQEPLQGHTMHLSFTFLSLVLNLNSSSVFIFLWNWQFGRIHTIYFIECQFFDQVGGYDPDGLRRMSSCEVDGEGIGRVGDSGFVALITRGLGMWRKYWQNYLAVDGTGEKPRWLHTHDLEN